jgi:UDP-3-O-[3-hydroxymyristoyl] glucosamine N-acyltransferase
MNKKWIPVIVAIVGIIPIAGGGAATNWTFQIGDNTVITDSSNTETTVNEGDTIFGSLTDDIIERAVKAGACLQDPIPPEYQKACAER